MRIAIYGVGGFGREVAPLARHALEDRGFGHGDDRLVFVSDSAAEIGKRVNGVQTLDFDSVAKDGDWLISIAIADNALRRKLTQKCEAAGLGFASIAARSHLRYDGVTVGDGLIACGYTSFTSNLTIGRHFHCNIYSYVAHDCVIGDFVTFAPQVCCNGRVVIEDDVYVGTGVQLKQGAPDKPLVIGRGAVIGMGAVVTRDVAPGTVVVGNPAKPLVK